MAVIEAFQRSQSKNKMKIVPIRFRLTDGRDTQLFYLSELKIEQAYWSNETQSVRKRIAYDEDKRYEFDRQVAEIKTRILEWYKDTKVSGVVSAQALMMYMDSHRTPIESKSMPEGDVFLDAYSTYLRESRFTENRAKQHRVVIRDLERFQKYRAALLRYPGFLLTMQNFDKQMAKDFRFFIENEHILQTQYAELYRNEKCIEKRGKNTILAKLSAARAFTNWAHKEGVTSHKPFAGMKLDDETYGDPYMLTAEELSRLKRTRLHRHPKLEYFRDTFLFQSALGCRLSDLKALRGVNISKVADGLIVEYIAEKTHREHPKVLRIPMNETAAEIYHRRLENRDPHQLLFKFTDQYYNNALKKIFLAARLTRYVNILDSKNGGITQKRLCDVASSHMARRNFISQMFEVFTDQNLVSELSGHAYNSKAFVRYRRVTDDLRKKMVEKALKW